MTLSNYHDITADHSVIEWKTDKSTTYQGWTLIYQPNYPEVLIHSYISTSKIIIKDLQRYRYE